MKVSIELLTLRAAALPKDADTHLEQHIATYCGVAPSDVTGYKILKRSVDARKKPDVKLIYSLLADIRDGVRPKRSVDPGFAPSPIQPPVCKNLSGARHPVIIGSGPAGLFCAYILALAGAEPVVLERGKDVERRAVDIASFHSTRILNGESNILYGEGGAGAWSDGKLFTRVNDPRIAFVIETLVKFGAAPETGYFSRPHIGSDKLPGIIRNRRLEIESLGGTFRWDSAAESLHLKDGKARGVILKSGEKLEAPAVVACAGHSAREFALGLIRSGVGCSLKGFQIGCRIEHAQEFVNFIQYGTRTAPPSLGSAEYSFASRPTSDGKINGGTTFCMCPGGSVIASTAREGFLSTNGMSESRRDGKFANSAIVTSLAPNLFRNPEEAFSFLEQLEKSCFEAGGSDYTAPTQSAENFMRSLADETTSETSYSLGTRPARIDNLLPGGALASLRRTLKHIDNLVNGFIDNGRIIGLETHVSSPVRFDRNPETFETTLPGFYAAGEGAGMAGGITSSAADGIRAAEALLKNTAL